MKRLLAALVLVAGSASAQPAVTPAADGIFDAFKTHALVGIGEHHRIAQELDFYSALVSDPRFATDVGNVMVEFGGAAHQDIIDRYVDGQDVPYTELRKVWTDVVGWIPVVSGIGYANFFATVREVNMALPPQKRIHVWLGEPVIDWDKVKTHEDWLAINRTRDIHAAAVIEHEILARGRKSLVIYGAGHYTPPVPGALGEKLKQGGWDQSNWADTIRRQHPGVLYVVFFYNGTADKACTAQIESGTAGWPTPALVTPFKDSDLAIRLRACNMPKTADGTFPLGLTDAEKLQIATFYADTAAYGDAMLYLGPAATLTTSPFMPDRYLDGDYNRMVARHYLLQIGEVYPTYKVQDYAASKKVRP